ncbi:MAG: DNA-3-methyladenine glycosylase, partial [Candidatus Aenigmarchaeota archaeon]|nr:DNA-3-methyladenine glycosylase [Candidatus Aenigmarchaeota archaeon]
LSGRIVETEAYFGSDDPASRAYRKNIDNAGMSLQMFKKPGTTFVYMVHANWLLNVVARDKRSDAGAVLIRAVEPLEGIDVMFANRRKRNKNIGKVEELCSGPGKLTQAFGIDKSHSGLDILGNKIWIEKGERGFEIGTSHRIGVSRDLPEKLRFFIKGNRFVSK